MVQPKVNLVETYTLMESSVMQPRAIYSLGYWATLGEQCHRLGFAEGLQLRPGSWEAVAYSYGWRSDAAGNTGPAGAA